MAALLHVAAFTFPDVTSSFASTRANNCSDSYPMCPAASLGLKKINFTEYYARSVDLMKERAGPTSLLPLAENQVVVYDYVGQKEYGLWVDATLSKTAPKILNCTIFPFRNTVTKEHFKTSFLGFLPAQSSSEGSAPCGYSGKRCEVWGFVNNFSTSCEGHAYPGTEPIRGTFEPSSSSSIYRGITNDIFENTQMPKECHIGDSAIRWYHQTYLQDWIPSPAASVFQVPPDSQCATGQAAHGSVVTGASSPWLSGARGALPFHVPFLDQ
jgi:predicted DNA-binding transcriptional regulator AlpA